MSKKSAIVLFIGLVWCLAAKAQVASVAYYMKEEPISQGKKQAYPVAYLDSADFIRTIMPPDSDMDRRLFVVRDYYKNKKPKLVGQSTSNDNYVNLSGACIEFFSNGHRKSVKNYEKGKPIGEVTEYFPNGKLYLTGNIDSTGKITVNSCNDSTGKVLVENGSGHCLQYSNDFKTVFAEGSLVNGLEEGEWHGVLDNSANYVCTYEKGILKQGVAYDKNGNKHTFTIIEVEPEFKGGTMAFRRFIGKSLRYPIEAKEHNIQGKVFVSFIVNEDGHLSDFYIVRSVAPSLDEETLRVIKASPLWTPGFQYGIPVRAAYTIPVSFTLSFEDIPASPKSSPTSPASRY